MPIPIVKIIQIISNAKLLSTAGITQNLCLFFIALYPPYHNRAEKKCRKTALIVTGRDKFIYVKQGRILHKHSISLKILNPGGHEKRNVS